MASPAILVGGKAPAAMIAGPVLPRVASGTVRFVCRIGIRHYIGVAGMAGPTGERHPMIAGVISGTVTE